MKPEIIVVDENDNVIGSGIRGNNFDYSQFYRVSALWITNSKGEILLAQRALNKKHHPGKWGPAVAGTNDIGESYESNIIKEAQEEIGLTNIKPKKYLKKKIIGQYNHFTQWFTLVVENKIEEFTIQQEEVAQIKWFSSKELLKQIEEHPELFLDSFKEIFFELSY